MEPSKDFLSGISAGLTAGSLLFMGLYGLYLYWLNRDRAYFLYALYGFISCGQILIQILSVSNLWQGQTYLFYAPGLDFLSYIICSLFIVNLINLSQTHPSWWYWYKLVLITYLVLAFVFFYLRVINTSLYNPFLKFAYTILLEPLHIHSIFISFLAYPYNLLLVTIPLLCFMLLIILRSHSHLKGYLLVMIAFMFVTLIPLVFRKLTHSDNIGYIHLEVDNGESMYLSNVEFKGADGQKSLDFSLIEVVSHLGLVLQGFCFALALAYRSQLVERENIVIKATYTEQLEQELAQRTQQLREQDRLLEEQRFHQLKTDFEQKQAETEMAALRAQMNPHFIFNCLNSIKLYAIDNEPAKASEYLTKFARLIRLVLENSRVNKVTLENELEALQLYLEMEALRFEDKLQFYVHVDPSIELDFVEIPPLLIQPYVENAIWHGLMHKLEGGTVWVQVEQLEENQLIIRIKDDGVGRAKAEELKSKSATKRKSFGMKMTSERIGLINQLYQAQTMVQIHDLTDSQGAPAGTVVVLQIPI